MLFLLDGTTIPQFGNGIISVIKKITVSNIIQTRLGLSPNLGIVG